MNKRFYLIIFLMICRYVISSAQTNVSGFISTNTTWNLAGSPYIVVGNVLVSHGFTLTIDPGVIVKFNTDKALQIDGELIAIGTAQNKITFTSNQVIPSGGDWAKIHFADTCVNAILDVNGNYLSGSIMKYCDVLYGGGLGNGEIHIESSSPYFNHCNIMYSMTDGIYCHGASYILDSSAVKHCDGYGLSFHQIQSTSCGLLVANDSIENNLSGGLCIDGVAGCSIIINKNYFAGNTLNGAINFFGTPSFYANVKVTENYFLNNSGDYTFFIAEGNNVLLAKNYFASNSASSSIAYLWGNADSVKCNRFIGNQAGQHGVVNINSSNSSVESNIFDGNINNATYGVSVTEVQGNTGTNTFSFSNNTIRNNLSPSGVCCKFSIDLYGQPLMNIDHNDFTNNTANEIIYITNPGFTTTGNNFLHFKFNNLANPASQYEFYNNFAYGYPDIYVDSNYWGSINTQHIDSVIYDYFDDATKSVVYYSPSLFSPVVVDTTCAPILISGINITESNFTINVFPNPASTYFTIKFDKTINNGTLKIYNILGENVYTENIFNESKKEIKLKNVSQGIYFVKVFDGEKSYCRKLIIEHN